MQHEVNDAIAKGEHYKKVVITQKMVGQPLDPFLLAELFNLSMAEGTVIKKILAAGERGNKSKTQDYADCIGALERAIELNVKFNDWAEGLG